MLHPNLIKHVTLDGHSLTLESFIAVARFGASVELSSEAMRLMEESRALADRISQEGRVAYGITTGFGEFQKVAVAKELSNQLSTNLILSHCTAAGEPYPNEVVRGMMLLRVNNFCAGYSGVRPLLAQMLVQMLNKNVVPVVPQKGSLGSSGDLAPLAHMTLPMLGLGEAVYEGKRLSGAEAMRLAGIETLDTLVSKEGLGMTNGTCAMTSVGAVTLYDALCAAQLADIISSMTLEALTGLRSAFDPRIHAVRGQKGQIKVAENMRMLLENSEILDHCQQDRVQDAYALRCIPQIHGACRDALQFVQEKVEIELNAVTDNPLLFLDDEAVISGGTFSNSVSSYVVSGLNYEAVNGDGYTYHSTMNAAVAAAGDNGDVNVADSAGEQKGTFTVEYNDGTGKTVRIYTTTHNPELPTMTRDGYKFKGWTVNGGTTVYTDFSTYEFTNDGATLTAVWSANSYYYYAPTTTDTKTDTTKGSPKTFDAGVGIYAVTALLSVTGMAWAGKKRH